MDNLKDILTSYTEKPSADCWAKIGSRLDAVMPVAGGEAAPVETASKAGHAARAFRMAGSAKIVGGIATAVVVGTAVTLGVLLHRPSQTEESPSAPVAQTETPAEPVVEEAVLQDTLRVETQSSKSTVSSENTLPVVDAPAESVSTVSPASGAPTAETPKPVTRIEPIALAPVAKTTVPAIHNNATIATTPLTPPVSFSNNRQDDPVLQNLPEDAIDQTPPVKLEIPNVFTPNGDGVNDYFVILGSEFCAKKQLIVRNRAGNVVFRSNQYENNWNGDGCPDGVYSYQFVFTSNNIEQTMTGLVTIIRK